MNDETEKMLNRTFQFGVDSLVFLSSLPKIEVFHVPRYQVAKSSTSIGANYEEAQGAESRKDFIHKIGIVSKEARESHYWLRVIRAVADSNMNKLEGLLSEAEELRKIFVSIKLSAEQSES